MISRKMKLKQKQSGFSLVEVLMAAGILSVGMLLVATMFPLGMHLTAVASERTMAAIVADQAFAKIQLYGVELSPGRTLLTNSNECLDFNDVSESLIAPIEFAYPPTNPHSDRSQYYWSALCRKADGDSSDRTVQVIVFVSRKRGGGLKYYYRDRSSEELYEDADWPVSVFVNMDASAGDNIIELDESDVKYGTFINSSSTIVDNATGQIYRVLERDGDDITLDRDWAGITGLGIVWLIAPPVAGGANPVVAVFQKIIKF